MRRPRWTFARGLGPRKLGGRFGRGAEPPSEPERMVIARQILQSR